MVTVKRRVEAAIRMQMGVLHPWFKQISESNVKPGDLWGRHTSVSYMTQEQNYGP